jgi:hypothetical protein
MNPAENWQTHSGSTEPETPMPAPAPAALPAAAAPPSFLRKNPGLAALLSLAPGMGNIYNGLYLRGVTFFLVITSLIAIASRSHPLFGMAIAFFWIFNVIDAYRQATLINYGYAQDLGLLDMPHHPRAGQGGMAAGILLTLIGLFAVCDRYFDIRLDWIFDLWPFALVVAGSCLIWGAIRDRKRAGAV